jgi:D-alanyl-D-alanine carboxypeptidase
MAQWTRVALTAFLIIVALGRSSVAQGPPPEIRALIDDIVVAANADADAWERFAQSKFAPDYLKTQTREERAAIHHQIADRFGTVTRGGVMRAGPGAPLQINVTGSKSNGVIVVAVDDKTFRITSVSLGAPAGREASNGLPPIPIDRSLTSEQIDQRLHAYFSKLAQDDVFSGVALVARNGTPVFMRAYGFADRDKKIENTVRTRFNIGSINKAFTQIAINQLIAEGKLSLKDTLGKFYPDYPQAISRSATIEQLLNHRAGLADFFGPQFNTANKMDFASNADYFKFVGSLPPTFAPGERNQYCNGCYIALGAIVSKVSGMPYEKYVADNVFARAEMTSTGYPRSDQPAADIALGYTRRRNSQDLTTSRPQDVVSNITMHGVAGSAAGGGYSTALDLLTFVKAVKAGRFPSADPNMGIAGGAPGTSAAVESGGEWTVIVLTNFDPPTGEQLANAIASALRR